TIISVTGLGSAVKITPSRLSRPPSLLGLKRWSQPTVISARRFCLPNRQRHRICPTYIEEYVENLIKTVKTRSISRNSKI
ncbi:hypothetical protein ACC676_34175, partial [Rhizobium ruizarguesonis]